MAVVPKNISFRSVLMIWYTIISSTTSHVVALGRLVKAATPSKAAHDTKRDARGHGEKETCEECRFTNTPVRVADTSSK